MPKYVTVTVFAAKHGVSPQAVRRAISADNIPGAKRVELYGVSRRNDHVWIIPLNAEYIRHKRGPKPGNSQAERIAKEESQV